MFSSNTSPAHGASNAAALSSSAAGPAHGAGAPLHAESAQESGGATCAWFLAWKNVVRESFSSDAMAVNLWKQWTSHLLGLRSHGGEGGDVVFLSPPLSSRDAHQSKFASASCREAFGTSRPGSGLLPPPSLEPLLGPFVGSLCWTRLGTPCDLPGTPLRTLGPPDPCWDLSGLDLLGTYSPSLTAAPPPFLETFPPPDCRGGERKRCKRLQLLALLFCMSMPLANSRVQTMGHA